jgi:hypothetical protein
MALATWAEEFLFLARRLSPLTQEAYRRDIDKYAPLRRLLHRPLPADEIDDDIGAGERLVIVIDEYVAVRVLLAEWPDRLPPDELALPTSRHWRAPTLWRNSGPFRVGDSGIGTVEDAPVRVSWSCGHRAGRPAARGSGTS